MSKENPEKVDAYLVAGGRFHDIDYARLELLKLLSEHPYIRVKVGSDYEDTASIAASSLLISYTCDIRPSENAQVGIRDWVANGGCENPSFSPLFCVSLMITLLDTE